MFFFSKRTLAREFARKSDTYKVVDNGTTAKKRWGVSVIA